MEKMTTIKSMKSSDIYRRSMRKVRERDWWLMANGLFNFFFFSLFVASSFLIFEINTMSTTMDQVVKKAKDSFGQMFDKSLHDLVRGIRNHKENEVIFVGNQSHQISLALFFPRRSISTKQWMRLNKNLNKIIWLLKLMQWTN